MATPNSYTVILQEGETIVLPSDANIVGIFTEDGGTITSSCGTPPPVSTYKCGVFYMNIDSDNNTNHPNDETDTKYTKIIIDTLQYDLDGYLNSTNDPAYLNAFVPSGGLFEFTHINRFEIDDSGDNKRQAVYLYFKVADTYFDKLQLQIKSHTSGETRPNTQYYKPLTEDEQAGAGNLACDSYPF